MSNFPLLGSIFLFILGMFSFESFSSVILVDSELFLINNLLFVTRYDIIMKSSFMKTDKKISWY